jgi:hypothetical protein
MKLKNLKKKIDRIETRMQEDSKKLTRLKRKLNALAAVKARKAEKKAAARAIARQTANSPTLGSGRGKEQKRKLNLSPERRAALSAAMKARWAAKRAAVATGMQDTATGQVFVVGQLRQSP